MVTLKYSHILQKLGIKALTSMQEVALKNIRQQSEVILLSPTGSGKTLAFLLPILETIIPENGSIQALILTPSRELALQIEDVVRKCGCGVRITCCYGGHPINIEERSLAYPPDLLIGTPGRIRDHLEQRHIDVSTTTTIVLDEFDKSLEFGFQEDMQEIFAWLHGLQKKILTSATSTLEIPRFIGLSSPYTLNYLEEAVKINLTLKLINSPESEKLNTLFQLLCELGCAPTLIFCNYRERAEEVSNYLHELHIENTLYHGGMEQQERERALCKFRNGSSTILISTDLASRGLDIPEIKYIIHYHLPKNEEAFIHRNGRTARMHASGTAFILNTEFEPLPAYITTTLPTFNLKGLTTPPLAPEWITLYIGKGKKDKLNKMDIVGFLCQKGQLNKEEIGLIEVKDYHAFVAVKRSKFKKLLARIQGEKIKNMKTKIAPST